EDDPLFASVAITVVEGTEEGGNDFLRRAEDDVGHRLLAGAEASFQAEMKQKFLDREGGEVHAEPAVVPFLPRSDAEYLLREGGKAIGLVLISRRQTDARFLLADVTATDQVAEEGGELPADEDRNPNPPAGGDDGSRCFRLLVAIDERFQHFA